MLFSPSPLLKEEDRKYSIITTGYATVYSICLENQKESILLIANSSEEGNYQCFAYWMRHTNIHVSTCIHKYALRYTQKQAFNPHADKAIARTEYQGNSNL
uniref:Uncharacterized protein n=1 Tax=Rhizophora mucronata TaxID=61149 RepID=A0A2P2LH16_RHIMU